MKTLKITINQVEFNLTDEQVEYLKNQLLIKEVIAKPLPTTWEEAFDIILPNKYVNSSGQVSNVNICKGSYQETKSHVPSEKHAKSVLAMCKLMTIAEAYNKGVEGELEYMIDRNVDGNRLYVCEGNYLGNPILFKKEEHAEHCLEHFKGLWNDFFMI